MMKFKTIFTLFFLLLSFKDIFASENSVYEFSWLDPDKEVYVLQNRKYRKDSKLTLSLLGGNTISGAFIDSYTLQGRVSYFFTENWGLEFFYAKNSGTENATAKGVIEQGTVPYYRKVEGYYGGFLLWSPFYAKINTFNKILYFDWILGAGLAQVEDKNNKRAFDTPSSNELTSETHTGGAWTTGLRFYLTESWAVRLDVTGIHYKGEKARNNNSSRTNDQVYFKNYDLTLGLAYTF